MQPWKNIITRRNVLFGVAAVGATAAIPIINSSSNQNNFVSIEDFAEYHFNGKFLSSEVHANPIWILRLLGAAASVATILDYLNLRPNFSSRPDFSLGRDCEDNFRRRTSEQQRNGMTSFAGVSRANTDNNAAFIAMRDSNAERGAIVSQYGAKGAAITLQGDEPDWLRASLEALNRSYGTQGGDLARAASVTRRIDNSSSNGISYRAFETANKGGFLFDPRNDGSYDGSIVVNTPNRYPLVVRVSRNA